MTHRSPSPQIADGYKHRATEGNIINVAKGGGVTFAAKLFLSAARFALAVLLARLMGAHEYGLYTLALSTATLGSGLTLLGMDAALVRYIAIAVSRRDEPGLWGTLQIGLGAGLLASTIFSTGLFALAYPIAERLFGDASLAPLLQLAAAIVPALTLADLLSSASRGFKRMDYSAFAQFVAQPIARIVLTLALALIGMSAGAAVIVYGLATAISALIQIYLLNRQFSLRRPIAAARRDTGAVARFALPFWLSSLITTYQGSVQTLLVGALSSIAGAGIFAMADQLNTLGSLFSSSINVSARPTIAELHDRGEREQLEQLYQTTAKWSLIVSLPIFLCTTLFAEQILSIFGSDFVYGAPTLAILACANLVNVGTGMGGIILDMTGYTRLKLINSGIRFLLHLSMSVLLIPRWGIVGAALTVLFTETAVNLLRLLQVRALLGLLPYNSSFVKPIVAAAAALFTTLALSRWLAPVLTVPVALALMALLCAVYVATLLLLGLSPLERAMLGQMGRRIRTVFARG